MVYTTDNGEDHHGQKNRWPVVMVGNAGGTLKADGRFLRFGSIACYPNRDGTRPEGPVTYALSEFFATIAHGVGVPAPETFAAGGFHKNRGPIPQLLA
jgi:hypothetical protein